MRRIILTIGVGLSLLAAACGEATYADLEKELVDEGLTGDQASCIVQGLEAADIPAESVTDGAIESAGLPEEAGDIVFDCMFSSAIGVDADDLGIDPEDLGLDTSDLSFEDGNAYGDNATLDALWDGCEGGDGAACDELYWTSEVGSQYEAFGNTCGNRVPDGALSCETEMG